MELVRIAALFAGLFHLGLTFFVLSRNLRSSVNRAYALWGFSLTVWNLALFAKSYAKTDSEALPWIRIINFAVVFLPVSILHLCLLIAQVSWPRLLKILYWVTGALALSVFTSYYIDGAIKTNTVAGYYGKTGPLFNVYSGIYAFVAAVTLAMLFRRQQQLAGLHRTRVRALMWAYTCLLVCGTNDLLPLKIKDFTQYPIINVQFYPIGSMGAIVFGLVVGYGVLQHQLLDIHVGLSRFAAHLVRMFFMFLLGVFLILVAAGVSRVNLQLAHLACFMVALAITIVVSVLLFPRLLGKGEDQLERRLLGERLEYHDRVVEWISTLKSRGEARQVVPELHDLLVKVVRVKSFQVILLDETTQSFSLHHSHPDRLLGPVVGLTAESPVIRYFQQPNSDYLVCKIAYAMPGETELERAARQQMAHYDCEFCFPFFADRQMFGLILIGSKANGDPYTREDLRLLTELARNLTLVLNQVRLKNQILAAQEQELLGRMSRGLAHDLNNLLTPVQTFLQLCGQGLMSKEGMEELLPVALRNIETVRAYVNEALFFSRTHRLEVKPCRVDEIIRNAVEVMEPRARKKSVQFRLDGMSPVVVEMDGVMIQRLLGNLIANAIDASPQGSVVQVHLVRLPPTETGRDWVRIKVIDSGEGISRDNLEKVFTPYFTTKDRGDGTRGFGLGLAIARRIVHLHGGNLSIASVEKKGTTLQVDLPGRHTPDEVQPGNKLAQVMSR